MHASHLAPFTFPDLVGIQTICRGLPQEDDDGQSDSMDALHSLALCRLRSRAAGDRPGHFGTGGAVGFADPEAGVAFGYVMNHVIPRWQSSRNRALIEAVYDALQPR